MIDLSLNFAGETRTFWTTAHVRASDLRDGDVAKIAGVWRWIYDINEEQIDEVKKLLADLPETMVVVRYAIDEQSDPSNFEDTLIVMRGTDLVEIQVPAPRPRVKMTLPDPPTHDGADDA
jgi:hypothetical protein